MSFIAPDPLLDELLKGPWGDDFLMRTSLEVEEVIPVDYGIRLNLSRGRIILMTAKASSLREETMIDLSTGVLHIRTGVVRVEMKGFWENNRYPLLRLQDKITKLKYWPGDMESCYRNFRNMVKYVSGVDPYVF